MNVSLLTSRQNKPAYPKEVDVGFFFNFENQVIQLPVNPEKITVTFDGNNKTEEVFKLGEINLLKHRKLASVSFESFFPYESWLPFIRTKGSFKSSKFYKDFFQGLMDNQKTARFIVTGQPDINMMVSVEKFEFYHQAGDHEDAYYSLNLKEYRDHRIIKLDPETGEPLNSENASGEVIVPTSLTLDAPVYLTGVPTWYSDGQGPLDEYSQYPCKINYIEKNAAYPYNLWDEAQGKLIGWAKASMLVLR